MFENDDVIDHLVGLRQIEGGLDEGRALGLGFFGLGEQLHHAFAGGHKGVSIQKQALLDEHDGLVLRQLASGLDGDGGLLGIGIPDDLQPREILVNEQDLRKRCVRKLQFHAAAGFDGVLGPDGLALGGVGAR